MENKTFEKNNLGEYLVSNIEELLAARVQDVTKNPEAIGNMVNAKPNGTVDFIDPPRTNVTFDKKANMPMPEFVNGGNRAAAAYVHTTTLEDYLEAYKSTEKTMDYNVLTTALAFAPAETIEKYSDLFQASIEACNNSAVEAMKKVPLSAHSMKVFKERQNNLKTIQQSFDMLHERANDFIANSVHEILGIEDDKVAPKDNSTQEMGE